MEPSYPQRICWWFFVGAASASRDDVESDEMAEYVTLKRQVNHIYVILMVKLIIIQYMYNITWINWYHQPFWITYIERISAIDAPSSKLSTANMESNHAFLGQMLHRSRFYWTVAPFEGNQQLDHQPCLRESKGSTCVNILTLTHGRCLMMVNSNKLSCLVVASRSS